MYSTSAKKAYACTNTDHSFFISQVILELDDYS